MPKFEGDLRVGPQPSWDDLETPFVDYLKAKFNEPGPTQALSKFAGFKMANIPAGVDTGDPYKLSEEEAQERAKQRGVNIDVPPEGLTPEAFDILVEQRQERLTRQDAADRSPNGLRTVAGLGSLFAGQLLDPLNIATAFTPVGQEYFAAKLAAQTGVLGKAAVIGARGAAEGLVGTAILQPAVSIAERTFDPDYTFYEDAANLAFGTAFGAGVHLGSEGAKGLYRAVRPKSKTRFDDYASMVGDDVSDSDAPGVGSNTDKPEFSKFVAASEIKIGDKYHPVLWDVVEADEINATMAKAENQYRDRSRVASDMQIAEMAKTLDPNLLLDAPVMDYGAPTLTRGGSIVGGNGRMAAITTAYQRGIGQHYKDGIAGQAERFGIDPQRVRGMNAPVLVRKLSADVDVRQAAIASNEGGAMRMSALEQAQVDAERLPLDSFEVAADGNLNTPTNIEAIGRWIDEFPPAQRSALIDADGWLSVEGATRLRNAILHKAWGDGGVLSRLVDAADPGSRNVADALIRSAPFIAEAREAIAGGYMWPLDITDDIRQAVDTLDTLRRSGKKWQDYLPQVDAFGNPITPEARILLAFFGENIRSPRMMGDLLQNYVASLKRAGGPHQVDMFGDGAPDKLKLLEMAIRETRENPTGYAAIELASAQNRKAALDVAIAQSEQGLHPTVEPFFKDMSTGEVADIASRAHDVGNVRGADGEDAAAVDLRNRRESSMTDLQRAEKAANEAEELLDDVLAGRVAEPASNYKPLPEAIDIDGTRRPTTNANGQPIHPTEEGVRNFWRWFGESKVVDDQGRPLVVYHGTDQEFDSFAREVLGNATGAQSAGQGFFFVSRADVATSYANYAAMDAPVRRELLQAEKAEMRGDWDGYDDAVARAESMESEISASPQRGQNVVASYLRLENPAEMNADGELFTTLQDQINKFIKTAKRGSDGAIIRNLDDDPRFSDRTGDHFVVFDPTQIKSATGNRGTFDPADANIVREPVQFELDLDYTGLYDNIETRPGTTEVQTEIGRSALRSVEERIFGSVNARRSQAAVLASDISKNFRQQGYVDWTGKKIASAEDLATLAQVVRDPRFETFRVIFTKNNEVVGVRPYSSRLAGAVSLGKDFVGKIQNEMEWIGADGYWMLHNHPSGIPEPSQADIRMTSGVSSEVDGFQGHVIIDHNEFHLITKSDATQSIPGKTKKMDLGSVDFKADPEAPHPLLGAWMQNQNDVINLGKRLEVGDGVAVVVGTGGRNGAVRTIIEVPETEILESGARGVARLRKMSRETGSTGLFLIVKNKVERFDEAAKSGLFDDVVAWADEKGSSARVGKLERMTIAEKRGQKSPYAVYEETGNYEALAAEREAQLQIDEQLERAKLDAVAFKAAAAHVGNDAAARAAIEAATGERMAESNFRALMDMLDRESGRWASPELAAQKIGERIVVQATVAKRNYALARAAAVRAISQAEGFGEANAKEGILSVIAGSQMKKKGARYSAAAEQKQFTGKFVGGLIKDLTEQGNLKLFLSDQMQAETARALHAINRAAVPDAKKLPKQAIEIAQAIHRQLEDSRLTRNRYGAWINDLQGYVVRQSHDMFKLRKAGAQEWIRFVLPRLDHDRMFGKGANVDVQAVLRSVYRDLAAGQHMKYLGIEDDLAYKGPANLAKKESQSRTIYFNGPDAEIEYLKKFGKGGLSTAVVDQLEAAGHAAGLLKALGPNPTATVTKMVDSVESKLIDAKDIDRMRRTRAAAMNTLAFVDGSANIPTNFMGARIGSLVRTLNSVSKLGSALASQFADLAGYGADVSYSGRGGMLSGIAEGIQGIVEGRTAPEKQRVLSSLGVVMDSMLGSLHSRFDAGDLIGGTQTILLNKFFKLNGMTWWTESLQASAALGYAHHLAQMADTSFSGLNEGMRRIFEIYGVTDAKWELMRKASSMQADGRAYMTPEGFDAIPDAELRTYIESMGRKVSETTVSNLRDNLKDTLRTIILDRIDQAVINPDARTRALLLRGTRRGDGWGEVARFVAQFKTFPVAFSQRVLKRAIYGYGSDTVGQALRNQHGELWNLAQLLIATTAFGYVSMSVKDAIKGRIPRNPIDHRTWMAAMQQGGGFGIYGDFLFGEMRSRFGGGMLQTVTGPTIGMIDDIFDVWGRLRAGDDAAAATFKLAWSNTPFTNLIYARTALDYLFVYGLQEQMNPGYLRRMERRIEKQNGQKFFLPPSRYANQF